MTVIGLTRRIEFPLLWSIQEQALGLGHPNWPVPAEAAEEPPVGTTEIAAG